MKILSIDLETTGLDPSTCQVIEFGAVLFDTVDGTTPVEDLPTFHAYIAREVYMGEPYALGMHAAIFQRIAAREPGYLYLGEDQLGPVFGDFLFKEGYSTEEETGKIPIICTGKNYAKFDDRFLSRVTSWVRRVSVGHRVLDPGTLFFDPEEDRKIPDTRECLKRAGLDTTVAHTAVEDARNVIRLFRYAWSS